MVVQARRYNISVLAPCLPRRIFCARCHDVCGNPCDATWCGGDIGRQGKEVRLPRYDRSRTLLILTGVARLSEVVTAT
ncbi:hypothetical protein EDD15DRAFT_2252917 [Pisolithus albus]|nr:hypothetical protein EDD15DRAFT_2252917 [Pisolithus albus]